MRLIIILIIAMVFTGGCFAASPVLDEAKAKSKELIASINEGVKYLSSVDDERRVLLEDYKAGKVDIAYVGEKLKDINKRYNEGAVIVADLKEKAAAIKAQIDKLDIPWWKKLWAYAILALTVAGGLTGHAYVGKAAALLKVATAIERLGASEPGNGIDLATIKALKIDLKGLEDKHIKRAAAAADPKK